jgi:hypothetical protein
MTKREKRQGGGWKKNKKMQAKEEEGQKLITLSVWRSATKASTTEGESIGKGSYALKGNKGGGRAHTRPHDQNGRKQRRGLYREGLIQTTKMEGNKGV